MGPQPVARIRVEREGLLWVNGVLCAEGGIALPVTPQGTLRLMHVPFSANWQTAAASIVFEEGYPVCRSGQAQLISWPDGTAEILLVNTAAMPWVEQMRCGEIKIMRQGEMVAVQTAGKMLPVGEGDKTELRPMGEGIYMARAGRNVLVVNEQGELILQTQADEVTVADAEWTLTRRSGDAAKHEEICRYSLEEGALREMGREMIFSPVIPQTAMAAAMAFCRAVQLGAMEEAWGYLEREMQSTCEVAVLQGFLGSFVEALPWPDALPGQTDMALLVPSGEGILRAKKVHFEIQKSENGFAIHDIRLATAGAFT